MDMNGKTVVVSGASRGIGEQTARIFAANGAKVALLARSAGAIDKIAQDIGENAIAVACDISDYEQVKVAIQRTEDAFGSIDVLINNAGIIEPISHLADANPADWAKVIDVNVTGVFNGIHAVLPSMRANGGGSVLTLSSGAAHSAIEAWSHYCTSKAAVNMLNRCLHNEEAANGIRAIGLSPGTVATQMQRDIKASGINPVSQLDWEDHIPAEWPARALMWMCSPASDEWCGKEISLRDDSIRRQIGLI